MKQQQQSPLNSGSRRRDERDFNLREWAMKAQIGREPTNSRRYSASYLRSFREDSKSFRSNVTISSTASSPGYPFRDEIDPATYSFTTAIKALQARSGYVWECLSPEPGFVLNSKWNEAEKYICNPLSGEVPMECLSAKTLSGRSFRANRITMSAPLFYSTRHVQTKRHGFSQEDDEIQLQIQGKKIDSMTRDVGTQSTPQELSSSSPSPTSTPTIEERSIKRSETEGGDSRNSNNSSAKLKSEEEEDDEVKETREGIAETKGEKEERKRDKICRCSSGIGCLSWKSLWMKKRQTDTHKSTSNTS